MTSRPVSTHAGSGAVAVTPHHLATRAAVEVMENGGNAADAIVAANAVLGMVLPTTCGVGGDLFAIVHRPGEDLPEVLNASGRGGAGLDADRLRDRGHATMPLREPDSITVPGCVDGWVALLERHGTRPLAGLLAPAIAFGQEGFEASPELAADLTRIEAMIGGQPSADALYPDRKPPSPGDTLRRPGLAATLEGIARDGRDAFYRGRVAESIIAATHGILTDDDLAENSSDWVEPIGVDVFGLRGWTVPPNSQGYLTLAAAVLVEALDPPTDPNDPAFHHAVIEAYRAMAWERDDLVADPRFAPMDVDLLLDRRRILDRLPSLDPDMVALWPEPGEVPGGTAYFCAMDADGMAVSAIQSNFTGIGSGISAGSTGVFLHNRGGGFSLVPGHPNEAAPGKRPLHTLSPTLWTRGGHAAIVLGTRGGHQQPQYLAQVVALLLHAGLDAAAVQDFPRWHADGPGPTGSTLTVESRMPGTVVDGLERRGHFVEMGPDHPQGWGPVSLITIDEHGAHVAAADPRVTSALAGGS
ncbi:MAG TPA: gamma-glutamyltransferase [Acidimicrobiia bacterium]|nr:gamma-glutamyltransferase [Acidimicrobiia bacterium]